MTQARATLWKPNTVIKASILAHGVAGIGFIVDPASTLIWLGILASNHGLLTMGGLLPRAKLLGPNITRLPQSAIAKRQIALTFDDGPDPVVTPQILAILSEHKARATFFCIGRRAEQYPELIKAIVSQGHQVENHSYSHSAAFAFNGTKGIFTEITRTQETLRQLTGKPPRFFRPIAGIRNPLLEPVLSKLGMRLVSWSHRGFDTQLKNPHRLYHRLKKGLSAGSILLMHDGNAAHTHDAVAVSVACLPSILQAIADSGLTAVTLNEAFNEPHE